MIIDTELQIILQISNINYLKKINIFKNYSNRPSDQSFNTSDRI